MVLIDPSEGFGEDVNLVSRLVIPDMLAEFNVAVRFGCEIADAKDGVLIIGDGANREPIAVDTLVAARDAGPADTNTVEGRTRKGRRIHCVGEAAGADGTPLGDAERRSALPPDLAWKSDRAWAFVA